MYRCRICDKLYPSDISSEYDCCPECEEAIAEALEEAREIEEDVSLEEYLSNLIEERYNDEESSH
jgi:hypothetical protein